MRLAFGFLVLCMAASDAGACTCPRPTVAQSLMRSSDVFLGTVLSVRLQGRNGFKGRIRVERSWKGTPAGRALTVYIPAVCGVGLSQHHPVIIFAGRQTE